MGLDLGKRNIITIVCEGGERLKYTTKQSNFESSLTRFNLILPREKKCGVEQAETELSAFSYRTSSPEEYLEYLKVKARSDA